MSSTLAMLHTGPVVIPTFKELAAAHLPGVRIVNYLDDCIVGDIESAATDEVPKPVQRRLELLGRAALESGADAILITCSSISGVAAHVQEAVGIPVLRVDEAMADEAVTAGRRIGVVATLPTTLEPTCALIAERARIAGVDVEIERALCREAFEFVSAGDGEGHDRVVRNAVEQLAGTVDVIVLAQASMARAVAGLRTDVPVLSSPELGVLRARQVIDNLVAARAGEQCA